MPETRDTTAGSGRVWFVTGVARGLGRAIAESVLEAGECLVGTVRKPGDGKELAAAYPQRARIVEADVTDSRSVSQAVAAALETFGRIDVLVNNAGYTLLAGIEGASEDEIRAQFETNTFGTFRATRAVLPAMRAAGGGVVILISSVAGVSAAPALGYYAASKHAVEGFGESLSKEVAEHGIRVTLVEPGLFRTDTLGASLHESGSDNAHDGVVGKTREALKGLDGKQPGDPRQLAAALLKLADEPHPPLHLPLDPGATGSIRPKLEQQLHELESWAGKLGAATPSA